MSMTADVTATIDLVGRPVMTPDGELTSVTSERGSEVFLARTPGCAYPATQMVALPVLGERVRGVAGVPEIEGMEVGWLGLRQEPSGPLAPSGTLDVLVLADGGLREVQVAPAAAEARRVVRGRASEGERAAMEALLGEARAHRGTREAHQRYLDRLVDRAHEEANEREWCSEFDDFMERNGLPRRVFTHDLKISVSATLYVTRDGGDLDQVIESLTTEEVLDLLGQDEDEVNWTAERDYS